VAARGADDRKVSLARNLFHLGENGMARRDEIVEIL